MSPYSLEDLEWLRSQGWWGGFKGYLRRIHVEKEVASSSLSCLSHSPACYDAKVRMCDRLDQRLVSV